MARDAARLPAARPSSCSASASTSPTTRPPRRRCSTWSWPAGASSSASSSGSCGCSTSRSPTAPRSRCCACCAARRSLGPLPAFALTLAFVLSPYFFGASFTLLTDNLAILFALLALERVHAFSRDGSLGAFALACLCIGAAVLTRQSFLWLVPVAAFFLLRAERFACREALAGAALLALALAPLAAARARVERAGPAQRGSRLVRPVHRPPGLRARRADAANGGLHAWRCSASTRLSCSGRRRCAGCACCAARRDAWRAGPPALPPVAPWPLW